MPSSSPPARSTSATPWSNLAVPTATSTNPVIRSSSNSTDDELLRLIEDAHRVANGARTSVVERGDRLEGGDDQHLAADSLAQRHSSRRELELEWDEEDNARRARDVAVHMWNNRRSHPTVLDLDDLSEDDSMSLEEPLDRPSLDYTTSNVGLGRDGVGLSAGGLFGFPTFGGLLEDSEEDDDDELIEEVEEPIFGFDGDGLEDDVETAVWEYQQELARRPMYNASSIWPGLVGEQPLNPAPSSSSSRRLSAPPPVFTASRPDESNVPLDPSSSTSFSSFLTPGASFVGHQTFGRTASRFHPRTRRPDPTSSAAVANAAHRATGNPSEWEPREVPHIWSNPQFNDTALTSHPTFAPYPSATATRVASNPPDVGPPSSFSPHQPSSSSTSSTPQNPVNRPTNPTRHYVVPPFRPSSSSASAPTAAPQSDSRLNHPPSQSQSNLRALSARYAPYSSPSLALPPAFAATLATARSNLPSAQTSRSPPTTSTTSSTATATQQAPIPPNLTPVERARMNVARYHNPAARSNPASWREVADELMVRLRPGATLTRTVDGNGDYGVAEDCEGENESEKWRVQVNILSYDPSDCHLTGLMNAYGIQSPTKSDRLGTSPPSPDSAASRVTTYFSAYVIDPVRSGLLLSPSRTGSGGNGRGGLKASQNSEAESWIQIGPFRGMSRAEFLDKAKDTKWVEEVTKGYVLMRWKEEDFVNIKATESTLSINGFYHCALNRSTGVIEGLYSDPASTPYQRLDLTPSNPTGAFSLGTFALR